jgi:hypothetical protein
MAGGNRQTAERETKRGKAPASLANLKGGSRKGVPNKTTAALKDMILGALNNKGGVTYLEKQADQNPTAFLSLIGKVLPMTIAGTGEAGEIIHRIELVGVRPE